MKTNKKRLNFAIEQNRKMPNRGYKKGFNVFEGQGFGYEWDGEKYVHIYHTGALYIGDDVDIFTNVTIHRGTKESDKTIIGKGTKVDSGVIIAHNVKIGEHCLIHGNAVLCGSVEVGDKCIVNAGVVINRKYKIGNNVEILPNSWVCSNIPDGEMWGGYPAKKIKTI